MEYKCFRCGHIWDSRVKNPKACPKCKSYKWEEKPKETKEKEKDNEIL